MTDLLALKLDARQWEKLGQRFAGMVPKIQRAEWESVQAGGLMVQTDIRRALGRVMGVKYGIMTKVVTSHTAKSGASFVMYVRSPYDAKIYGPTLPITLFGVSGGKGGVTASPWGRSRTFKRSFVATKSANSSSIMPFRARLGHDRKPVRRIYGPNPAKEMLKDPMVLLFYQSTRRHVGAALEKRLPKAFG